MALIDELIEDMPKEIQDMVRTHLTIVTRMGAEELIEWVKQITGRHWQGAYQSLNDKMKPEERVAEQERLNALIAAYNVQNKARSDMWIAFFNALIAALIRRGMQEIIEPGS